MISTDGMALSEWFTGYGPPSPTVAVPNGKTENLAVVQATKLLVLSVLDLCWNPKEEGSFTNEDMFEL